MSTIAQIKEIDGFSAFVLSNEHLSIAVLPQLGGKISSLIHRLSGREWMWKPDSFKGYFQSKLTTPFQDSTLVGWDECLPTIAPCHWKERDLPDHGEVWMSEAKVDLHSLTRGIIQTTMELPLSPLRFVRRLSFQESTVVTEYELENLSGDEEPFVWAMHPLFAIEEGDRLFFSSDLRKQLPHESWVDYLEFPEAGDPGCRKAFADRLTDGLAGFRNIHTHHGLAIRWQGPCNPIFGLWLTRGGWHGHHHVALEPTNARDDSLIDAVARGIHGTLPPHGRQTWQVELELF